MQSPKKEKVDPSMPIVLINMKKLSQGERKAVSDGIMNMYNAEGCGICKKPGADVFFFTTHSRCAHKKCYDKIATALQPIIDATKDMDNGETNMTMIDVMKEVDTVAATHDCATIGEFFDKHPKLFATVIKELATYV